MHRTTLAWLVLVLGTSGAFAACGDASSSPFASDSSLREGGQVVEPDRCLAPARIHEKPGCEAPPAAVR